MAFVKIENNKVVQKQPYEEDGFVEVSENIIAGMTHDGSGSYGDDNFSVVAEDKTWEDVEALQRALIFAHYDTIEIHERQVAHDGTAEADYNITPAKYQEYLDYFVDVRLNDEKTHSTPEEAITALNGLTIPS